MQLAFQACRIAILLHLALIEPHGKLDQTVGAKNKTIKGGRA
jgi:hypothetical protein